MAGVLRVPPGRAGRVWLERRLDLAQQAAARLDQKLRILRAEQARADVVLERTRPEWEARCREAETWLLRAVLLGGQGAVRPAAGFPLAEVTVGWTTSMGTTYPADSACVVPPADPRTAPLAAAAVIEAAAACRRALEAAIREAVAEEAARAIAAEVLSTTRRLRGVRDRWVPRLEEALARRRLELDEAEQAEAVNLRWAARAQARTQARAVGGDRR